METEKVQFSEKDIRPENLMAAQREKVIIDLGRLLTRRSEFVEVDCPACSKDDKAFKFEKNGLTYLECNQCATLYISPRPTPEVLDWFYKGSVNYEFWNNFIFPASESVRRQKVFVPRVDLVLEICKTHGVSPDVLLEIGSGFGTFCGELNSRNVFKRVIAVEPTPKLAETCRQRGIEVVEDVIEKADLKGISADVVVSFEVIEHLFSPRAFIEGCVSRLKPGGILIFTCPNGQGFDIRELKTESPAVDHEHLNYFNPESLSALLEDIGLSVLERRTPGRLDADIVRNQVLAGRHELPAGSFLHEVLVTRWDELGLAFQNFLSEHQLSSNMMVVARKPLPH